MYHCINVKRRKKVWTYCDEFRFAMLPASWGNYPPGIVLLGSSSSTKFFRVIFDWTGQTFLTSFVQESWPLILHEYRCSFIKPCILINHVMHAQPTRVSDIQSPLLAMKRLDLHAASKLVCVENTYYKNLALSHGMHKHFYGTIIITILVFH